MAYLKLGSSAQAGRLGVRKGAENAVKFRGVPFVWASKRGSKGSNSGTTNPRDTWFRRYSQKNNIRYNQRASRQG